MDHQVDGIVLIEFEVKTIVGSFYTTYQPVNVCVCVWTLDFAGTRIPCGRAC